MTLRLPAALLLLSLAGLLSACATVAPSGGPALPVSALDLVWPQGDKALAHLDAFENPALKVGLISLRGGATMPEHASPLAVLLTASSGRGTVVTATGSYALDAAHAVFLPGGEKHSVTAQDGEVLHIAVLALKRGAAPTAHHGP